MQLDFTQLRSKFEKLTSLRPMPHREYVEVYIKAYYLPENSFEEWIKEHKVFKCDYNYCERSYFFRVCRECIHTIVFRRNIR